LLSLFLRHDPLIDPTRKPPEMYTLIENFCLGTRRLELFGRPHCLRRGWVTVGNFDPSEEFLREKGASLWNREQWQAKCKVGETGKALVPNTPGIIFVTYYIHQSNNCVSEIEALRPKSPQRSNNNLPAASTTSQTNVMTNNIVMANPNPMMGGFAPNPQGMMPGMMPMGVPMGMGMGLPIGMNPAMQMMPMGMNIGMGPMGLQQYAPAHTATMGIPMWMGIPDGVNPIMNNQMWMGDGSMNSMSGWGAGDPNWQNV
jgi:mRNA m6A methyltransferase non-catalytic subunit